MISYLFIDEEGSPQPQEWMKVTSASEHMVILSPAVTSFC